MTTSLQKLDHLEKVLSILGVITALAAGLYFLPLCCAFVICFFILIFLLYIFLPWQSADWDVKVEEKRKFRKIIRGSHIVIRSIIGLAVVSCLICGLTTKMLPRAADDFCSDSVADIQKNSRLSRNLVEVKIASTSTTSLTNSVLGVGNGGTAVVLPVPLAIDYFLLPVTKFVVNLSWLAALAIFICVWVLLVVEFLVDHPHKVPTP